MSRALYTLGGLALFGAHVVALPMLVDGCRKDELSVRLTGAPVAAAFDLAGEVPASLASEVAFHVDGQGPGLRYAQWSVSYGGGFTRQVGAAQLVGPFQDPASPPCGARLVVGQRLLDDGQHSPGTVAALVKAGIEEQMAGFEQWPIGEFEGVSKVSVTWARFDDEVDPKSLFGNPTPDPTTVFRKARRTDGYARVVVKVDLTRLSATVTVAMVPMILDGKLDLKIYLHADISTGIGAVDWVIHKLPIEGYVTKTIREQIDGALVTAFEPPPPLELPGGRSLTFSYCPDAYLAMQSADWAGLPLAVAFSGTADAHALPPRFGAAAPAQVTKDTSIAFDLDLDTLNAILFELWRTKFLDEQLAAAKLDERFAEDPTVRDLLTLRISPLTLALPPVVSQGPSGLRMSADLRVALHDGPTVTPGRVWGVLDVGLGGAKTDVGLADLELACEPEPGLLKPCYGDLVNAMRARAPDVRAQLSGVLTTILDDLFTGRRVAAEDQPAELVLGAPVTTSKPAGPSATIRIALDGKLEAVAPSRGCPRRSTSICVGPTRGTGCYTTDGDAVTLALVLDETVCETISQSTLELDRPTSLALSCRRGEAAGHDALLCARGGDDDFLDALIVDELVEDTVVLGPGNGLKLRLEGKPAGASFVGKERVATIVVAAEPIQEGDWDARF